MQRITKGEAIRMIEGSLAFSPIGVQHMVLMIKKNPGPTYKEGVEKLIGVARHAAHMTPVKDLTFKWELVGTNDWTYLGSDGHEYGGVVLGADGVWYAQLECGCEFKWNTEKEAKDVVMANPIKGELAVTIGELCGAGDSE